MTNSTPHLGGVIVQLAERNEVAGIHFVDLQSHAILGSGSDYSGTRLHHNVFSGAASGRDILWSVLLRAESGAIRDVSITDSVFRDGDALGGIQVRHRAQSSGDYQLERNVFSDLGGRAYHLWSQGRSRIQARILDCSADNIGLGNRNSDSILPHLCGSSEQDVLVQNYHYKNTKQVGNRSNTGLEVFFVGAPRPQDDDWCVDAKLTLRILDSVFENAVTDAIQLTNFGTRSRLDIELRRCKILGAKPKQVGGAISLLAQNPANRGSRTRLLIENTDILDSTAYGLAISDRGEGYTSTVDLGGGALGSAGGNRILRSAAGEVQAIQANPVARHCWWGGDPPRTDLQGDTSTLEADPPLAQDPRSR
jgi:hypothetical protein